MFKTITTTAAVFLLVFAGTAPAADSRYTAAAKRALRHNQPFVIYVGCAQADVPNAASCQVRSLRGFSAPCVVVCVPDGEGWFNVATTLHHAATAAEVAAVIPVDPDFPLAHEALDEVNATRARRGLRPFVRDDSLSKAARAAATFRAERLTQGHTPNDFAFVPAGGQATAAGCAAWEPSWGWGSCCTDENWAVAGAAWVLGRDGRRYMHLFVR
jgi:hypothetical protein